MKDQRKSVAWKLLGREIARGLVLAILFFGFQRWFENTPPGVVIQQSLYDLAQWTFRVNGEAGQIAVIDLNGMQHEQGLTPESMYTNRNALAGILSEVVKKHPCRGGIDLDFDFMLDPGVERRKAEVNFLREVDNLNKGSQFNCHPSRSITEDAHIVLGAYGALGLGEQVFANPKWKKYAVFVGFPNLEVNQVRLSMTQEIEMRNGTANAANPVFPSLSAAMAGKTITSLPLLHWAIDRQMELNSNAFRAQHFFVDYSAVDKWKMIPHNTLGGENLNGKYVLMGRGLDADGNDRFVAPGHRRGLIPGVLVHASAIYTLLNGGLIALSATGSLFLDLLLTSVAILIVDFINFRIRRGGREPGTAADLLMQVAATIVLLLVAVLLAQMSSHVLWEDFFVMIVAIWVGWAIGRLTSEHIATEEMKEVDESIDHHLSINIDVRESKSHRAGG